MPDETPPSLSSRLKALASRPVGRGKEQATPAPADPAVPSQSEPSAAPAAVTADEQPTGDLPDLAAPAAEQQPASERRTVDEQQAEPDAETTASFGAIGEETEQILATDLAGVKEQGDPSVSGGTGSGTPEPSGAHAGDDDASVEPARKGARLRGLLRRPGRTEPDVPAPAAPAATAAPAGPAAAAHMPAPAEDEVAAGKPSFTERAALRRRMKALRARRDVGLLELGAIVLDQRRFGDASSGTLTRQRTDELTDIDGEIAAIELALDEDQSTVSLSEALGVVRCAGCSALLGPRDRFCANCGAARPETKTDEPRDQAGTA